MADRLLENIIATEKRIQAEVSAEQERVAAWRDRELTMLEFSSAAAGEAEDDRRSRLLAEKKVMLEREGAAVERSASAWCQRLSDLDDATLCRVLKRHLAVLLPGGEHDHPHGQG